MENLEFQRHINQFDFANAKDEKSRERLSHALSFMEDFYELQEGKDDIEGPKFIKSLNGLFDELIREGKEITGMYGDDEDRGVMLELDVDDGKGGKYEAPMTANRSNKKMMAQ